MEHEQLDAIVFDVQELMDQDDKFGTLSLLGEAKDAGLNVYTIQMNGKQYRGVGKVIPALDALDAIKTLESNYGYSPGNIGYLSFPGSQSVEGMGVQVFTVDTLKKKLNSLDSTTDGLNRAPIYSHPGQRTEQYFPPDAFWR